MKKICLSIIVCSGILFGQTKLTLNEAMITAVKQNSEIIKAKEEINASKGKYWSGISLAQPEVNLSYEYTPLSKTLNNFGEKTIEISQGFDFPTIYYLRSNKLNREINIAKSEYEKITTEILSRVKKYYYEVKAKEEEIKIAKDNSDLADEFNKKASIRYSAGEGTYLEKLTAKVQYTQALNNLESTENELKTSLSSLLLLLGISDSQRDKYLLVDDFSFHQKVFSLDDLVKKAESKNSVLRKARHNTETFSIKKSLAWSSLLPSFKLSYSRQALDGGNNDYYGVGFSASVPLWFLFDQRGQIEEATAEYKASEYEYEGIRNSIITDIKNDFLILKNNEREVLLYLNEIIPQAEEVYRIADKSYEAGEITYLEFLQAKQTLIETRSGYVKVLLKYHISLINLEESSGLLFEEINFNGDE